MRTLLLGGAGFIGLHLARRLTADGHQVCIVDDFSRARHDQDLTTVCEHPAVTVVSADLTSAEAWADLEHGWDQVYLLAAVVGVRNVERDPARVIRVNTMTVMNLLDWIRPVEDGRVFFASTSEVYAGGVEAGVVGIPTAENVPLMISDIAAPRFAYAASKLLGEAALLHAATAKRFDLVIGRFHNVYGPRMGSDHVIPEMLMRAVNGEEPFAVPGADQYRAFCYIDDAIEAMLRLMESPKASRRIVHIGNDTETTKIVDLAALVLEATGHTATVHAEPAPSGSVSRRWPDLSLLRRLTGYEPKVSLAEGVIRTRDWYAAWMRPGRKRKPIAFYYGNGQLDRLTEYRTVVLQPDFYRARDLLYLGQRGVRTLAYLSLSEDQGPPAPWQRDDRNPDWGGHFVHVDHPGWVDHVLNQADTALAMGFDGLFLDTLNVELTYPEDVPHLISLITAMRAMAGSAYILANRGFGMLPELAELVDGMLFESFSVRWVEDGYAPWPQDVLEHHAQIAEGLAELGLDLFALDYADSDGLAAFAARRAEQFGLEVFVSDRALSQL
ncbi:NAD-dependent epimerase/dehydratase family protein [Hamadaea sp. NPDC051192]|uniref:NAD-dependent epimerase/dehydratase family protein n=1 Tax=Hamadaea sp. NPDC051192 TaxID=3154940 RepID=UPI003417A2DD